MDDAPSQSEDFAEVHLPEPAGGADRRMEPATRIDWKQHLISLRETATATLDRLLEYLHRRRPSVADTPTSSELNQHLAATLESMSARQDTLEAMLHSVAASGELNDRSAAPPAWAVELQAVLADRLAAFESTLQEFRRKTGVRDAGDVGAPVVEDIVEPSHVNSASLPDDIRGNGTDWLATMLGPVLYGDPKMERAGTWLRQSVLAGNSDALQLLGQLVVFRFSNSDRKPTVLKDVGEAFYRCFPKTRDVADPFEEALSAWLKKQCEEAGLANSVELVHPGERFDATRHSAIERGGVEITAVFGWVVLREGGRIFSKASVQTR